MLQQTRAPSCPIERSRMTIGFQIKMKKSKCIVEEIKTESERWDNSNEMRCKNIEMRDIVGAFAFLFDSKRMNLICNRDIYTTPMLISNLASISRALCRSQSSICPPRSLLARSRIVLIQ